MPRRRPIAAIGLALLLLVAGCSGAGSGGAEPQGLSGGDGGDVAATGTPMEETAAADAGDSGGADKQMGADVPRTNRKLIKTGEVAIEVDSFEAAEANLSAAARSAGGYVSDTSMRTEEVGNQTYTRGTVVLRIPAGKFSGFMERVKDEGHVVRSDTGTKDVTREYTDLQARLKNLEAERDRLRELYRQANDTEDVLMVERRLSEVQGRIERIQAQLRNLDNRVTYATITVHIQEPRPDYEPPEQQEWYETGIFAAFMESVSGVGTVVRATVVAIAYALPYLLAFGLPIIGAAVLGWRRFGR